MLSYTQADSTLAAARGGRKKLENNTYLERIDAETIGVRLHETFVVRINRDGTYSLHTGGWMTVTTKDRINAYGPVGVSQHKGDWFLGDGTPFVDGMTITSEGVPV
jgi:hypothetical protein